MEQSMIDAASGGALMDKAPAIARHLFSNMAGNRQQFRVRGGAGTLRATGESHNVCGICTLMEHPTDMCPTLQEDESKKIESIGALGGGHQFRRLLYLSRQFDN
ncbi:hypothetical protein CR513_60277, partial [Mucuna pruriens]